MGARKGQEVVVVGAVCLAVGAADEGLVTAQKKRLKETKIRHHSCVTYLHMFPPKSLLSLMKAPKPRGRRRRHMDQISPIASTLVDLICLFHPTSHTLMRRSVSRIVLVYTTLKR